MSKAVGLDIGHSAVKVSVKGKTFQFPTAVRPAATINDEAEAARAAHETIEVANKKYFIGETAIIQGAQLIGLSENWIETPEHTALMKAGMKKAIEAGAPRDAIVVMGLPAHLFGRQKTRLKELAEQHLGTEVLVMSQPFGPFNHLMLDERGVVNNTESLVGQSWAVIEIGFFTTDFALIQRNRWTEEASGSCAGVRIAAQLLQRALAEERGISADLVECDEAIRTRCIRDFGRTLDVGSEVDRAVSVLAGEVSDTAARLLESHARRLDGIVVAGGGAPLLRDHLAARWGNVVLAENSRYSVAEGMRRFGELKMIVRAADSTVAA